MKSKMRYVIKKKNVTPLKAMMGAIDMAQKVITTSKFWDCECKENYIHTAKHNFCPKCGSHIDDAPDARKAELHLYDKTKDCSIIVEDVFDVAEVEERIRESILNMDNEQVVAFYNEMFPKSKIKYMCFAGGDTVYTVKKKKEEVIK